MSSLDNSLNRDTNRRHYNTIADAWQYLLGHNFHWGLFQDVNEGLHSATDRLIDLMISQVDLSESSHLLDVGCGTGGPARYVARKTGTKVTGFSTSEEGVCRAKKFGRDATISHLLTFEVKDALDNTFDDMQFSAAMLLEMSHLIRDKKRLILETSRVVEIGGKVVLCDLTLRRRLSAKEIVERQDDIRLLETCFGKARLEPLESYIPLFESSGLKDIEILDLSNQVTPTIECWRDNVKNNRRELSEFVSDDHVERFIRSCEILEEYFKSDVWGYGYIIGEKQMHVDVNFDSMDMQQRLF